MHVLQLSHETLLRPTLVGRIHEKIRAYYLIPEQAAEESGCENCSESGQENSPLEANLRMLFIAIR